MGDHPRLRAHRVAEACFALARSTTFDGERDAAIARGIAVCTKAGLNLDSFQIPGRVRQPHPATASTPRGAASQSQYTREELRDLMRAHRQHMGTDSMMAAAMRGFASRLDDAMASVGVRDGETVYDARRRNFEQAAAEARDRDARRSAR